MSYVEFRPYVPVAKRREKALRETNKLKKKGTQIQPIDIKKRKITETFWGNAWCNHIESFSGYSNRLPRGRTYVRNGSVCHLAISQGRVDAIVSGSSLYNVHITIKSLPEKKWTTIKKACTGKIGSLLDLLKGTLSDGVMHVVCDRQHGLFPLSKEINLSCDCPDWATMCKHVAAVLYGVGARLDHSPEKLFQLRDVDHDELFTSSAVDIETTQGSASKRRRIADSTIADVFDIELSTTAPSSSAKTTAKTTRIKTPSTRATASKRNRVATTKGRQKKSSLPRYFSGYVIRKKRRELGLTQHAFSQRVGVSAATISNWERRGRKKLNIRDHVMTALQRLWQK